MASTAKTLTFVIPAYNMESYLDRCVNSLLSASDISDLEVLIVDDGSKDGTLEHQSGRRARDSSGEQGPRRRGEHRYRGGDRHVRQSGGCG